MERSLGLTVSCLTFDDPRLRLGLGLVAERSGSQGGWGPGSGRTDVGGCPKYCRQDRPVWTHDVPLQLEPGLLYHREEVPYSTVATGDGRPHLLVLQSE